MVYRVGPCRVPEPPEFDWVFLGPEDGHAMQIGAPWAQSDIDEIISKYFPGAKQGFTLVSLVVPGQEIPEHVDHKENCSERVHVPITADPQCVFVTEGEEFYLEPGFVWVVNPMVPHSVIHRGTENRVHLMFNVLREKIL